MEREGGLLSADTRETTRVGVGASVDEVIFLL